jgi:HEAT repeat protein
LRGLSEPDPELRRDALESLSRFHFADAIAPLCRLFRERAEPDVRRAVLHSLGRAHDLRAGEFLLEVLRHSAETPGKPGNDDPLRGEAYRQLLRYDHPELVPLLRRSLDLDSGSARPALEALLSHLTAS